MSSKKLKHQLSSFFLFKKMDFYLCCGKSLSLTFSRRAGGGARKRNSDTRRKRRGAGWSHYFSFSPFFVHSFVLSLRHFLLLLKFGFVNVVTCISLLLHGFVKLQHAFVKVVTWICCPLLNNNQDLKSFRSFCFELKVLNESKY